jgi:hypothetical protein
VLRQVTLRNRDVKVYFGRVTETAWLSPNPQLPHMYGLRSHSEVWARQARTPHGAAPALDTQRNHSDPLNAAGAPSHKPGALAWEELKVGNGLHFLLGTAADTFKADGHQDDRSLQLWLRQPLRRDRVATAPGSQE